MDLFKKDVRGGVWVWSVYPTLKGYSTESGLVGGEKIKKCYTVDEGLAGRNKLEQISLYMLSKAKKKKSLGYVENIGDVGGDLKNELGQPCQMKATLLIDGHTPPVSVFDGNSYAQRKYNGHRCTITMTEGVVSAYSSGGKPITSIAHVLKAVAISEGQYLDGELYIHGLSLQKISGHVRTENTTCKALKFMCFDQIINKKFKDRFDGIKKQKSKHIVIAETIKVKSFKQVKKLFHRFRSEKYEGLMLRHGIGSYECGIRSKGILKIKRLKGEGYNDQEFEVKRIIASSEGWARLVCIAPNGKTFKVSCHGTHSEKTEVLKNKEKYIGKKVKIEFPEWTDAGKPSQPVALMWRDKENE